MMKRITPDKRELVNMLLDGVALFTDADKSFMLRSEGPGFKVVPRPSSDCKVGRPFDMTCFEYSELFVEVPWYENMPGCGVLCHYSNGVVLCTGFSVDGDNVRGHYRQHGSKYVVNIKNLTPLTKDDPRIIG